jgi:hypothetical protein
MTGATPAGDVEARLDRLRGRALPVNHNARTIAALAANPGCPRRALMDASGTDKQKIAEHIGFPAPFGQSQFAIARGNVFEAIVKDNGADLLLALMREHIGLAIELLDAHPSAEPVHLGVPVKFPDGWEAHQAVMAHLSQFRVPAG